MPHSSVKKGQGMRTPTPKFPDKLIPEMVMNNPQALAEVRGYNNAIDVCEKYFSALREVVLGKKKEYNQLDMKEEREKAIYNIALEDIAGLFGND